MGPKKRAERDLNVQHHMVVFAALSGHENAEWAWSEVSKNWTVETLDEISLRFLPAVYANIGIGVEDFNQKVAGKYRFNFALNLYRLRVLKSIFASLNSEDICYRVTKGLAISLRVQSLGFRIMGDVDIVVKQKNLRRLLEILASHGFHDKYFVNCSHFQVSLNHEKYTFINSEGIELDIHVAESAFPSIVFRKMFKLAAQEVLWEDVKILLPSDDLLFEHSLLHGKQFSSVTDRWQTLVDISILSKKSSSTYSQQFRSVSGAFSGLNKLGPDKRLSDLTRVSSEIFSSKSISRYYRLNRALSYSLKFSKPQIIRFQQYSTGSNTSRIWSVFRYAIWTSLHNRLIIERFIVRYMGGFLTMPSCKLDTYRRYLVRDNKDFITSARSPVEFRFKIQLNEIVKRCDIYLQSHSFNENNFEIFCNGKLLGSNNRVEGFGVTYNGTSSDLEVSIRNPSHSCIACLPTFDDLQIWVDSTESIAQ